ncbi:MAG: mobile mystery protein B [Sinimarinibacterium flocculans]|uniref:mobile mystery protein B n=1 Tax=Sinimarinibacterium flocculans TaxID=985250 RepID=UPI003C320EE3
MSEEPDGATPLDPDEREGLRFKHVQTRGELDRLEQANIVDGLRWLNRQKTLDVLSDAFVYRLHKELFGQVWRWAGQRRQTEKNIGVAPHQVDVQLRNLLDNTRHQIDHKAYPPVELALRFHHRLVQIHVFPNGNGRHARIMTDALLRHCLHHPPIRWAGPTDDRDLQAAAAHRSAYIRALREADARNTAPLLKLFGGEPSRE